MTQQPRSEGGIGPIEHSPVYGLVVDEIRKAIHMGLYRPGDKLPPERELAVRLGVSRTSVREAVRVLEGEEYVKIRRGAGGGIIVRSRVRDEERFAPIVRAMLPQIDEIFEFRRAVEGEAAWLAAQRRTGDDLAKLEAAFHAIEESLETQRFRAADSAFHLGIADAAANTWMRSAIESARAAIWVPVDRVVDHVFQTAVFHHGQILKAIRDQDANLARQLAAEHVEFTRQDLHRVAEAGTPRNSPFSDADLTQSSVARRPRKLTQQEP